MYFDFAWFKMCECVLSSPCNAFISITPLSGSCKNIKHNIEEKIPNAGVI